MFPSKSIGISDPPSPARSEKGTAAVKGCSYRTAAEQKARVTYDNLLRLIDDPDIRDPLKFLREREIVHYQRFGEGLGLATDRLNSKNFYAFNPSFDRK